MPQNTTAQAKEKRESAQNQLARFISKCSPAREGRAALTKLRRLASGAVELVYDNYDWLVVATTATTEVNATAKAQWREERTRRVTKNSFFVNSFASSRLRG